jgi:hypothetical protein
MPSLAILFHNRRESGASHWLEFVHRALERQRAHGAAVG